MRQLKFANKLFRLKHAHILSDNFHSVKGWLYRRKEVSAVNALKARVEQRVEYSQSCLVLSSLYLNQNSLDDAEFYAVLALQNKPQQRLAYEALAEVLKAKGELDEVQECYRDIFPESVAARHFPGLREQLCAVS